MNTEHYVLKISPQGQLTLPKALRQRLGVAPGSRVTVTPTAKKTLQVSDELPIEKYFGTMGRSITGGRDATEYIREMRDEDWAKVERKLGITDSPKS